MAPKRDVRSRTSSSSASSSSRTLALSPSVRLPAAKRAVAKSKPTAKPAAMKVMKKVMKKKAMKAMKKVPARKPAGKSKAKAKSQRRHRAVDLGNSSDSDLELSMSDRRDERVSRIYHDWNDWAQFNRSFNEPPPCSFEAYLAEQMTAHGWSFDGNNWQKGHLNHMGPAADDDDDAD